MAGPSPVCLVQDGSGAFVSTVNGVNVTPGDTITIKLADRTGLGSGSASWALTVIGTDDSTSAPALTFNAGPPFSYSFTAPAAGATIIFQSSVDDGTTRPIPAGYTTTFGIYTLTTGNQRVVSINERTEGNAAVGYVAQINAGIRNPSGSSFTAANDLSGSNVSQSVVGIRGTAVASGTPADGASLVKQNGAGYVTAQIVPNLVAAMYPVNANATPYASGATGTDDRSFLASADTAANAGLTAGTYGNITISKGCFRVSSNITFTSKVTFKRPGMLKPDAGVVVTFLNGIEASEDQFCLDISQGGSFVFQDAARFRGVHLYHANNVVHPSWFGARYDPTNNTTFCDGPAFQAAINSLPQGGTVKLASGTLTLGTTTYTYPIVIGPGNGKNANVRIEGTGGSLITPNNGFNSFIARSATPYAAPQYTLVGGSVVRGLAFGVFGGPAMRLTDWNGLSGSMNGASKFSFRQRWIPLAAGQFPVVSNWGFLRYAGGTALTGGISTAFIQNGTATTCTFTWGDDTFPGSGGAHTATVTVPGGGWQLGHEYEITAEFDGTQSSPGATLYCTVFDATAGTCAMATATTAGVTHTIGESPYNEFLIGGLPNSTPFSSTPSSISGFGALVSVQYVSGTNNNITPTGTAAQVATATNASPIVITTTAASGLATGDWVYITGGTGNTAINSTPFQVTVSGSNITLVGSTGNGAYNANTGTIVQAFRPVVGQYVASGTPWSSSTFSFMCNFQSGLVLPDAMLFGPKPSTPAAVLTATSANPAVITSANSLYLTGDTVTIAGATGNTAINGTWQITVAGANITLVGCDAHLAGAYNASSATITDSNVYYSTIDCHVKRTSTPFVSMLLRPWGGFAGIPGGANFSCEKFSTVQTDLFIICEGSPRIEEVSVGGAIWFDGCLNATLNRSTVSAYQSALSGLYVTTSDARLTNSGPLDGGGVLNLALSDSTVLVENCYWQPTTGHTLYSVLCQALGYTSSYYFRGCTIDGEFGTNSLNAGVLVAGGVSHFEYDGPDNITNAIAPMFLFSNTSTVPGDCFKIGGFYKSLNGTPLIDFDTSINPPCANIVLADVSGSTGNGATIYSLTTDVRFVRSVSGEQPSWYWMPTAASTNNLQLGCASDVVVCPFGSDVTLTGIVSPLIWANQTAPTGRINFTNRNGTNNVLFTHLDASSAAKNRIRTPTGSTYTLAPGRSVALRRTESGPAWFGNKVVAVGKTVMGYDLTGAVQGVFVCTVGGTTGAKSLAVTWTNAAGNINSVAHGLHTGDLVQMPAVLGVGGGFFITVVDANNFTLNSGPTTGAGSGTAYCVRTTASTAGVMPAWVTTTEGVSTTTDGSVTWLYMHAPEWTLEPTVDAPGGGFEPTITSSVTIANSKTDHPVNSTGGVITLTVPAATYVGQIHRVTDWGAAIETNPVTVTTGTSVKIQNPATGDRTSASFVFGPATGYRNGSTVELQWNGTLWVTR